MWELPVHSNVDGSLAKEETKGLYFEKGRGGKNGFFNGYALVGHLVYLKRSD